MSVCGSLLGVLPQRLDERGVWIMMLPSLRGRVVYCVRLAITIGLTCAWTFSSATLRLFTPGVLVTLAATSCAKPTFGGTVATSFDFVIGVGLAIAYNVCLLSAFPDTATTGLQTWWLNLVFLVLFTGAVSYSALPPLTAKLAIAVNAVILLSTYLSYLGSVPRSNNTFGSTAVGVISALIGACLPWMDLASQHMAVRTRFASANAFAVAAGKYAGHPGHGLESSCRDCEQPGR